MKIVIVGAGYAGLACHLVLAGPERPAAAHPNLAAALAWGATPHWTGDADRASVELARLQRVGVRIAVDDFGSGYSSLGFLMGLAVDTLKIDRTLLEFDTTRQGVLVNAVAELGRTLGLTVVVEGVETTQHLLRAREAGRSRLAWAR